METNPDPEAKPLIFQDTAEDTNTVQIFYGSNEQIIRPQDNQRIMREAWASERLGGLAIRPSGPISE